jgi:Lon protease-like protein
MATYEDVLRQARRLTPEGQQRLLDALKGEAGAQVVTPEALGKLLPHDPSEVAPLTESERAATAAALTELDRLAARIGAAWRDDMSAVDAVRDVRRDL